MFIDSHLPGTLNLPESWWVKYHIWPLQTVKSFPQDYMTQRLNCDFFFFFNSWTVTSAQADETPNGALGHKAMWYFNLWALSLFCNGNARFCILSLSMARNGELQASMNREGPPVYGCWAVFLFEKQGMITTLSSW